MQKRELITKTSKICFYIYMIVLVYFLFLSDGFGRVGLYNEYNYNLIPFREIKRFMNSGDLLSMWDRFVNLLGNIVAFMPFGALIRWVLNQKIKWYQATGYTCLFSLCVEGIQLIAKVGVFDVDDLILNTLGGFFGFCIYYMLSVINKRSEIKNER